MNRRGFLGSLMGAAIAAQQLDIEKLLWVPGEKTIFIPPPERMVRVRYCLPPMQWRLQHEGILATEYASIETEEITLSEFERRHGPVAAAQAASFSGNCPIEAFGFKRTGWIDRSRWLAYRSTTARVEMSAP